jgi:hypothetical protein
VCLCVFVCVWVNEEDRVGKGEMERDLFSFFLLCLKAKSLKRRGGGGLKIYIFLLVLAACCKVQAQGLFSNTLEWSPSARTTGQNKDTLLHSRHQSFIHSLLLL